MNLGKLSKSRVKFNVVPEEARVDMIFILI